MNKPLRPAGTRRFGFETRMVHAGSRPEPVTGARQTPIFQTTSYAFASAEQAASLFNLQDFGFVYSRLSNPTVAVLEERLANLEDARGTTCTASGHAAQMLALLPLMDPGLRFVASNRLYGGSVTQFSKTFGKFGWACDFVDITDLEQVRAAIGPDTRAIFTESLSNPGGVIADLEALARIAHDHGLPLIVDNTMATPFLCRPIEWGADLITHSTTKFLSGTGTAVGGALVDSGRMEWITPALCPALAAPNPAYHGLTFVETFGDMGVTMYGHAVGLRDIGAAMAPQNAFYTLLGIESLALRMRQHCDNALAVAQFLADHPKVAHVSHPLIVGGAQAEMAAKYLPRGAGAVFTVSITGDYAAASRVVERVELFTHLANIGDARSIILHPASTTHRQLSSVERAAAGAYDDTLRLSIGLETADDLIWDLAQALEAV